MPKLPDPTLFARRGGRWRLQLGAWVRGPELDAAAIRALPMIAALASSESIPDDLLLTAAAAGATTNDAFLGIVDGAEFSRAPCLCCYGAADAAGARAAARMLNKFRRYFAAESYVKSRAFARSVAALSRDLLPRDILAVKTHLVTLDATPAAVREVNASALEVCVAAPPCRPNVLWVYSTPNGRRLLRHLARRFRKAGAPVKVTVASSSSDIHPRYRYRMYEASLQAGAPGSLLDSALEWVRGRRRNERGGRRVEAGAEGRGRAKLNHSIHQHPRHSMANVAKMPAIKAVAVSPEILAAEIFKLIPGLLDAEPGNELPTRRARIEEAAGSYIEEIRVWARREGIEWTSDRNWRSHFWADILDVLDEVTQAQVVEIGHLLDDYKEKVLLDMSGRK